MFQGRTFWYEGICLPLQTGLLLRERICSPRGAKSFLKEQSSCKMDFDTREANPFQHEWYPFEKWGKCFQLEFFFRGALVRLNTCRVNVSEDPTRLHWYSGWSRPALVAAGSWKFVFCAPSHFNNTSFCVSYETTFYIHVNAKLYIWLASCKTYQTFILQNLILANIP